MARTASNPVRSCVGCRRRFAQDALTRFVRTASGWSADLRGARRKQAGRGAYLCSAECAERARKNKRYPGLGAAAAECGLIIREPMQEMNS
ncbi:MAG: YlxR family protein [Candidatus Eremiobacteraeota bacterium]|nr:YlxR family protein [Candidatus Eremiobacteraeota bacterium]